MDPQNLCYNEVWVFLTFHCRNIVHPEILGCSLLPIDLGPAVEEKGNNSEGEFNFMVCFEEFSSGPISMIDT